MNSIGSSIFAVLLVCIDSAAAAFLLSDGIVTMEQCFALHFLVCIGAALRSSLGAVGGTGNGTRILLGVISLFVTWFVPVIGVLITLFFDVRFGTPAEIVEEKAAAAKTFYRVGNPVSGRDRIKRLEKMDLEGLRSGFRFVYQGGKPLSREAIRQAFGIKRPWIILLLRRLAMECEGRVGILAQSGLREKVDRMRKRARWIDEWARTTEEGAEAACFLAAEAGFCQIRQALTSAGPDRNTLRQVAGHLRFLTKDGTEDALVVNRFIDALINLELFDEAYRVIMNYSVLDDVPVRLQLARYRAAQGIWVGMKNLCFEMSSSEWSPLSSASRHFWYMQLTSEAGGNRPA